MAAPARARIRARWGKRPGSCATCGSITITSGKWRVVRDTSRKSGDPRGHQKFVPMHPTDPPSEIDWQMGGLLCLMVFCFMHGATMRQRVGALARTIGRSMSLRRRKTR